MKFCSIMQHDVRGYGTIRPPIEDKSWGLNALSDGYKAYVQINSFTDAGLDQIAVYNNYQEEWNAEKALFTTDTHISQKRFVCFKLYAKFRRNRKYHLEPVEGGHRRIANVQATFCAKFDFNRGCLQDTTSLTVEHFTKSGLVLKDASVTTNQILSAYLTMVDEATQNEGFFSEIDTVLARYMTSWDITVPDFLRACRTASDMHSRQKRQSATKDPLVEIGHHASTYMLSMSVKALTNGPDLGHISYKGHNKFPAKKGVGDLSDSLNWNDDRRELSNMLPLTDMLYRDPFENYCRDPFSTLNRQQFLNEFKSPSLKLNDAGLYESDNSVTMEPPFLVSWEAMAVHAALGSNQRATVEMVNKWMLVPMFMHILTAHKNHKSLVETAKDNEELHREVLYVMRHHVHNHSASNLNAHPCMKMIYNFQTDPPCLPTSDYTIMHASLYLAEIVNAYLSDADFQKPRNEVQDRQALLTENAKYVAALFSTLNQNSCYPGLDTMIRGLGNYFLFFYILYFFSLLLLLLLFFFN